MADSVKVMVRVRPFNGREKDISDKKKDRLLSAIKMRDKTCAVVEHSIDEKGFELETERDAFEFDECFWSIPMEQQVSAMDFADQKTVYELSGRKGLQAAFDGYNVCIFAYGQTGSGKTHSMLGTEDDPGISLRLVDELFERIEGMTKTHPQIKVGVECMFYEVYNEKVRDLFNKKANIGDEAAPKIRQHPTKGVFVEGLHRKECTGATMTKRILERGTKERASAETKMNSRSSRSHAIFQIIVTQNDRLNGMQRVSLINLVDLAGSEKVKLSQVTGQAFVEAKNINKSLSTLRRVFDVLIDNSTRRKQEKPPYRDSVLTYCLSDSLGGNSKTMMIATVSPHESNVEDTLGTLRYALKAKAIVCNAKVNEEKSAAMMNAMRDEILALQVKLKSGGGNGEPSEEILNEIKAREDEIAVMEEREKELEKEREEMEERLKEAEVQHAELDVAIKEQRRDQFAAAFRNAFRITVEKKKQATSMLELETITKERDTLKKKLKVSDKDLTATKKAGDELKATSEKQQATATKEIKHRDLLIAQMKGKATAQHEEIEYMKKNTETLTKRAEALEASKDELQRRVQRGHDEIITTKAAVERERAEKERLSKVLEEKTKESADEMENLRKRRDKYKSMYLEANAKAEASQTIIDTLQKDRDGFITTLKSQQQVVKEQSLMAQRLADERKDSESKAARLERKLEAHASESRLSDDALREYQSAAAEWMCENSTMKGEVDRVNQGYNDLKAAISSPTFGAAARRSGSSPSGSALAPSTSMSASGGLRALPGGSVPRYRDAARASLGGGSLGSGPSPKGRGSVVAAARR